mmetsp:Transcript_11109/g.27155  ORF Transcript_11109/g.27155 Transcript_11109/m.27155 type:complete len:273 (-) Transcript_11109:2428-3246(-)
MPPRSASSVTSPPSTATAFSRVGTGSLKNGCPSRSAAVHRFFGSQERQQRRAKSSAESENASIASFRGSGLHAACAPDACAELDETEQQASDPDKRRDDPSSTSGASPGLLARRTSARPSTSSISIWCSPSVMMGAMSTSFSSFAACGFPADVVSCLEAPCPKCVAAVVLSVNTVPPPARPPVPPAPGVTPSVTLFGVLPVLSQAAAAAQLNALAANSAWHGVVGVCATAPAVVPASLPCVVRVPRCSVIASPLRAVAPCGKPAASTPAVAL